MAGLAGCYGGADQSLASNGNDKGGVIAAARLPYAARAPLEPALSPPLASAQSGRVCFPLCGLSKPIGFTFNLVDMRIAATAIAHKLTLVTENRKGFPMLEVTLLDPPSN